ncbi:putative phosphatase [Thalassocella blandensis]|nr:putative phosphatase [Thalassocella blandensis]
MSLAIFDLDNTLLGGDSDHSWGEFMVERKIVDEISFKKANDQFYEDYKAGNLDIEAYVAFALAPLRTLSTQQQQQFQAAFLEQKIKPLMLPKAQALIDKHRAAGDTLMIITATNRIITAPIAELLGIEILLATDPEIINGEITGKIDGIPCFQDGKVQRLALWMENTNETLDGSYFYSDSFNDIPLLEQVSYPYAVDPDEKLEKHARSHGWPVISLR